MKTAFLYTSAFASAAVFATACDPSYGIRSFRCDPSAGDCPTKYGVGTYVCCSDDPAAIDLSDVDAVALPSYGGGPGIPLYASANNNNGTSGFCIDTSSVPPAAGIMEVGPGQGCPLPCNPTWEKADITAVCGTATSCCATVELQESDCGLDMSLGANGCWRPVTGGDIQGLKGIDVSDWSASDHATHQDPGGGGCEAFVAAQAGAISAAGLSTNDALFACFRKLSVANQRGFCQGAMDCPLANPAHRDACEQKNDAEGRLDCG
ncbi:hypothetical protein DB30_05286 [Enhygromyxa salina]|uniref:Uncharacterized protein n=1 Tax=Enhygromyxa salina TaxID=215803 RepID=A0A0C2CXL0_9BACT|nr:hypothetical protein DB30_05286 [Enhygromyxa salina]